MTYREIFDDVVDIMKHDSATCIDIESADPAPFREEIREDMTDKEFAVLVNKYLYSFGLTGHLKFFEHNPNKPKTGPTDYFPFLTRRSGDRLYVVSANRKSGWSKGDIITELDGMTIPEAEKKYYWLLDEKDPERQRYTWMSVINTYIKKLTVIRKNTGITEKVEFSRIAEQDEGMDENGKFFFKKLSDDTVLIRFPDFMHKEEVDEIFAEFKKFVRKSGKNVIFDVRENGGGNDSFFNNFKPYLFPKGKNKYDGKKSASQMFYTERNCRNCAQAIESLSYPQKVKDRIIKSTMKNSGKGWSPVYSENEDFSFTITGKEKPENVYILTDEFCGSSGDSFVEIFSMSDKVTVIGRPTMGINDYSNVCMAEYGEMAFMYPMSRNIYINDGIRIMGKGHPVDVYVPWTPEHLERDVMLEKALEIIGQKKR